MESNEQTERTSKTETDSDNRLTALGGGHEGLEGSSRLEKGAMDMHNSVVIMGGGGRGWVEVEEGIREINGNWKKTQ